MHRRLAASPRLVLGVATSSAAILAILLAGCTSGAAGEPAANPVITGAPTSPAPVAGGTTHLPTCDAVTTALAGLQGNLAYNADLSASQTAQEAYDQRVCVYTTADAVTQLGVTVAAIPFQQAEIDGYATLPNAIADGRLAQYSGVLQTFATGDGDDGHLDSALYLFDTAISVTIQGVSKGDPTSVTIPQLTLPAAEDAAFAVRALVK
ncbi:MAG: hypothetical protein JWP19_1886 [Rhodoglobus sp.]|nr:hypothetical protein [Rhodoglobus sp.]